MLRYLRSTWNIFYRYRHLLFNLVGRDFKVKYRRSVLGIAWSVLNPLLMMGVMVLVFGTLFSGLIDRGSLPPVSVTGQPPVYAVYLLAGQLSFAFFNEATTTAMDSVMTNAQLIKKVYIPKYIFPLEKVLFSFVNTLFSMIALVLVIIFTRSAISWWVLMLPVVLLLQFAFNLGVGLILSAAVVFFRDIKHIYGVFVLALTYLTPIFYTEDIITIPAIRTIIRMNPMYWYVSMFRQVVVYGRAPTDYQWIATVGCAALSLLVGLLLFRKKQDDFILYI